MWYVARAFVHPMIHGLCGGFDQYNDTTDATNAPCSKGISEGVGQVWKGSGLYLEAAKTTTDESGILGAKSSSDDHQTELCLGFLTLFSL